MNSPNPLHIRLEGIGKKFGSEWIFKNVNLELDPGDKIVLLGGNGSGKSTLMQVISGYVLPNSGKLIYKAHDHLLENETYRNHLSIATPYLELVEDYTFEELIAHCMTFKPFVHGLNAQQIIEIAELKGAGGKYIRNYSSGMKQRAKLALAILADCPLLLLDEPASNLDKNALEWYKKMVLLYAEHKTIVVCSNSVKEEFSFCTRELNLADYKQI
jgi:ABC-type multidrug transport system ATPase subunit